MKINSNTFKKYFTPKFLKGCVFIFSVFIFSSCSTSNDKYNEGYKVGYTQGYQAATQDKQSRNNKSVEQTPIESHDDSENKQTGIDALKQINPNVPQKAIVVLKYIKEHQEAPEGYVGGRTFGNYENQLPKIDASGNKIKYREWDIHPKVEGKNRGAQRVVTGSDGRAWFTADHYNTFIEIKSQ